MKSQLCIIKVSNKRVSYPPHQTHPELLSLSLVHSACVSLSPSTTVEIKGIQHIFLYGLWMHQMLLICKGMYTYSCRYDCFLCNNFQGVHHWDVPQTLSNRECCVPILREKECEVREIWYRFNIISVSLSVSHHSDCIRLGSMLQQDIDNMCISLLSSLVKWCVAILK